MSVYLSRIKNVKVNKISVLRCELSGTGNDTHAGFNVATTKYTPTEMTVNHSSRTHVPRCIQKFQDWPPGAGTAAGTVLCHQVQLHRYYMS
jgi:hypothetical protein